MRIATALLALSVAHEGAASAADLEETVAVERGGTLFVDLDRGRVTVRSHDADVVRASARARGFGALFGDFELKHQGNDVLLEGSFSHSFLWGPRVTVEAWVPRQYSVQVYTRGGGVSISDVTGSIVAETRGGAIQVNACRGPASLETAGGRIDVSDLEGAVVAETSGGRIGMKRVIGNVEAVTSGGAIELREIDGRVEAQTSGGAVTAEFSGAPSGVIETSGARIDVSFAADAGVDLEAETSGGRVDVDHVVAGDAARSRDRVAGSINGGGAPLHLRTRGGNIRVRAR